MQVLTSTRPADWAMDTGELDVEEGTSVDDVKAGDNAASQGSDVRHVESQEYFRDVAIFQTREPVILCRHIESYKRMLVPLTGRCDIRVKSW